MLSKSPAIIRGTERTDYRIVPSSNVIPIWVVIREYRTMWISTGKAIVHAIGYFYETLDPTISLRAAPKPAMPPQTKNGPRPPNLSASAHVYLRNYSQNRGALLAFIP